MPPSDSHRLDRRAFVRLTALASASCLLPFSLARRPPAPADGAPAGPLDEALEIIARTGPEYNGLLANHAPMGAEALAAMGRADAILPWLAWYQSKKNLQPPPGTHQAISNGSWREALGDGRRMGDWGAFFQGLLQEGDWTFVLARWVDRLAPGMTASAAHGVLRTAHAARALAAADTPPRRHELAQGLAYWAARYQALPGWNSTAGGTLLPSEALAQVERRSDLRRAPASNLVERLRLLEKVDDFAAVIELVDPERDPSVFLSDLSATFAEVYLANATDFGSVIGFVHGVTGPGAVRLLLPHVPEKTRRSLLRYAWQMAAAFYATMARRPPVKKTEGKAPDPEELIERAVRARGAHSIKFTETCLREHALHPDPAYLLAAAHSIEALGEL